MWACFVTCCTGGVGTGSLKLAIKRASSPGLDMVKLERYVMHRSPGQQFFNVVLNIQYRKRDLSRCRVPSGSLAVFAPAGVAILPRSLLLEAPLLSGLSIALLASTKAAASYPGVVFMSTLPIRPSLLFLL